MAALTCYAASAVIPEFSADFILNDSKGKAVTGKIFIREKNKARNRHRRRSCDHHLVDG
jgi:hypothetical protein